MQSEQPKYRIGMTISACLWLGLFPLLQGGTYARITYDKWFIMLVLTAFTFLCFLADLPTPYNVILSEAKRSRRISPPAGNSYCSFLPLLLASALLFWTVVSCFFSGYGPDTWWLGKSARYEGLATRFCYFTLFACFFFSRVNLKPVLLSAAAGLAVFFAIVLLQRSGGNPLGLFPSGRSFEQNPEFQGTIGNIDMGTGYLLLLAGLFLYYILNTVCGIIQTKRGCHSEQSEAKLKNLPAAAMIILLSVALLICIYLIITMDVQFGAITLAVLFLFTLLRLIPKKWRLPLLLFVILIALLMVWFWPGSSGGIWELHEILHDRGRLSFGSNRVAVWSYSLRLAGEDLLLGGGSGTFASRFNEYIATHNLVVPDEQDGKPLPNYFDSPHNEYIAQLTDHGLPALLLFLALLLFAVFRRHDGWFPLLAPCSAAVLCYAVQAFFSFSVCIVAPMFWIILGMAFSE
ncbi:MAG: O-antigen ligase family protein [Eubacteriales bacterium]